MTTTPKSTAGLVVYAKDEQRVAAFYAALLGVDPTEVTPDFVVLESDALQLVVVRMPAEIVASVEVTDPPSVREDTALKPVFVVGDLDVARAAAAAAGGGIKPVEAEWRWGDGTVVDGFDPEGNVLQVRRNDT